MTLFERVQEFFLHKDLWFRLIKSFVRILVIIVGSGVTWYFLKILFVRLQDYFFKRSESQGEMASESERRAKTLVGLVRTGARIFIIAVVILSVLNEIGVSLGPLIASAGVASVAVGFGAQSLVKDVISGFFIILENQIRVGDYATINNISGFVQEINFRTAILRDSSGTVHVFPNGSISQISNFTKGWSAYVMDVNVAYKEDIDHVMEVMQEAYTELKSDDRFASVLLEPELEIYGLDRFADSALVIRARIKTLPLKQWETGRAYNRILKNKFDQYAIEIPFPHVVYVGDQGKDQTRTTKEDVQPKQQS